MEAPNLGAMQSNIETRFPLSSDKKKRRRKKHETIARVLEKLEAGESIENLAREFDCAPESILRWKLRRDGEPKAAIPSRTTEGSDPLARALGALGVKPVGPSKSAEAPRAPGGEIPSSPPPTPSVPKIAGAELTAENLPKILEGIDSMIMTGIAVAKAKGVPRDLVKQAMKMPESDKETLAFFAPYALEYADVILKYAKPVMAGLFVGFWGVSITTRGKDIAALGKNYADWKKEQDRAGKNPGEGAKNG